MRIKRKNVGEEKEMPKKRRNMRKKMRDLKLLE